MAEAPEHLRKTLEDFRQQLAARVAETQRTLAFVNVLEEQMGLPKTTLSGPGISWNVTVGSELRASDMESPGLGVRTTIENLRADEYLGDIPLEAAKKFLRRVRQAVHIDRIAQAIQDGGAAVKGADWKTELEASLLRSTREVVKIREGTYGLVEFYTAEQLKGLRAVRRQRPEPSRPKRRKKRAKKSEGSRSQEPSG